MSKKVPELNSASSADIAFLLLSYFLMTTTMNQDSGLQRRLPPMPAKDQEVQDDKKDQRRESHRMRSEPSDDSGHYSVFL